MLGDLSAKYESSGDPGNISDGVDDPGGKSYGCYQLASKMGSVTSFLNWAINNEGNPIYQQYGKALNDFEVGSEEFDAKWHEIAEADGETFEQMQHDYIMYAYYFPAADALREAGFDPDKHSATMQDVIWSRSVQYGAGQIVEMFEDAVHRMYNKDKQDHSGWPNLSYVDSREYDYDMIVAIYSYVCHTEEWTAPACRYGLYHRFENEQADALEALQNEG